MMWAGEPKRVPARCTFGDITMKISKKDALALAKVLHQHVAHCAVINDPEFQNTLEDLSARCHMFLVYGEEAEDEDGHECCDHGEEDEDDEAEDDLDEEEEDSSEEDKEDDEESGEDEESSEEDDDGDSEDEEDDLESDCYTTGDELHELTAVKSDEGAVEFEHVEADGDEGCRVDLLVDGYTQIEDVTYLRRKGKELHVRDGNADWSVFYVNKFPKDWAVALPLNQLVEVEH